MENEIKTNPEVEETCEHIDAEHLHDETMQKVNGGDGPTHCPDCGIPLSGRHWGYFECDKCGRKFWWA